MSNKITSLDIYNYLLTKYKKGWWHHDAFRVMVESVMVQNATWQQVNKAEATFKKHLTPKWIENIDEEYFANLIYSCRYSRVKTKTIKALTAWYKKYDYNEKNVIKLDTKTIRKELLAIKGIGPETADDILVYAFNKPSFIIDAYTRRLLIKLGFKFKNDNEIREFLIKGIPEDGKIYGWYHGAILQYSKDIEENKEDIMNLLKNKKSI